MASNSKDRSIDFSPFFLLYSDGKIDRLTHNSQLVSPSDDPKSSVRSKDVVIQSESSVAARIFMPKVTDPSQKFPLLIYTHGGAFVIGSLADPLFNDFITALVEKSNVIAVSIDYRLAPENSLPNAYDDSWEAFQWVLSHVNGKGPDPMETEGEGHGFHMFDLTSEKALDLMNGCTFESSWMKEDDQK